ncbi:MAG: phosphatase PAP2 family protein [Acidimicrobiales bacterium]
MPYDEELGATGGRTPPAQASPQRYPYDPQRAAAADRPREPGLADRLSLVTLKALLSGVGIFIVLEIVALVLGLAVVGRHGGGAIQGFDNTVEQWWIGHRAHLVSVSKVIATLGDAPALGIISIALTVILLALRQKMRALVPIICYIGGEALVLITRQVITRPRPPTANYPAPYAIPGVHETSFSYPSGHATAAVAVLIGLAVLALITWRAAVAWLPALLLTLLAFFVACSRLVLGVHWFSDVAFGMVLGISWGIAVALVLRDVPWPFGRQHLRSAHSL